MAIKATGTCLSFSATAPASDDVAGFDGLTWTAATELRVAGDLSASRAVSSATNLCTGLAEKTLGAIDNGNQAIELAFDYDNGGQVILHDAFHNNASNAVWIRRTLSDGHITYYKGEVSQETSTTAEGSEVVWKGQVEVTGALIEKAA